MTWIRMIERREATGFLLEVYSKIASRPRPAAYSPPHGDVSAILRVHSLDPALMGAVFAAAGSAQAGGVLSWADRELLAATASRVNHCFY